MRLRTPIFVMTLLMTLAISSPAVSQAISGLDDKEVAEALVKEITSCLDLLKSGKDLREREKGAVFLSEVFENYHSPYIRKRIKLAEEALAEIEKLVKKEGDRADRAQFAAERIRKRLADVRMIGEPAPPFSAVTIDGRSVSLSQMKGKVVLLDFWSIGSGPHGKYSNVVPGLKEHFEKYKDKGFEIVGINPADDKEEIEEFVRREKIPWPQIEDRERKICKGYNIDKRKTFLIGRDGKVADMKLYQSIVFCDGRLGEVLEKMFQEGPPAAPESEIRQGR